MKNEIQEKLKQKKDKYPNIISLWEKMIEQKEKDLNSLLLNCDKMLSNIDNITTDLSNETLLFLYLVKIHSA